MNSTTLATKPQVWGIKIEIGTRGVEPEHLLSYLSLAVTFDAVLIRTLTHTVQSRPSLEQAEKWIRAVLPEFEAQGVTLGHGELRERIPAAISQL